MDKDLNMLIISAIACGCCLTNSYWFYRLGKKHLGEDWYLYFVFLALGILFLVMIVIQYILYVRGGELSMDGFDILILVLGIVTGVILFALGLPFYKIVIYFVTIMFSVGMPIAIIFGIAKWIKNYDEEK